MSVDVLIRTRCKTFDATANGYVRSEGVGVLLLKPLEKALEDRDYIHGVVIGSAVNHGGRSNFLTAPNATAQAEVIEAALKNAHVDPKTISYIETHGTGTALGDPIEINGLKKAFDYFKDNHQYHCGLGTVKTNIGHLESAAGVAGIIKVLLSMQHQQLPGLLHFKKLNSNIEIKNSPFYIVDKNQPWQVATKRAGVSSFGMGGVNAHIILQEAPTINLQSPVKKTHRAYLMTLSAKKGRLKNYADAWLSYLELDILTDNDLNRIAYTLQTGRDHFEERICLIVHSITDFKQKLHDFIQQKNIVEVNKIFEAKDIDMDYLWRQQEWEKVATAWIQGARVDWQRFYKNHQPHRLPLPGYPFDKKSCWIETLTESKQDNPIKKEINYVLTDKDFYQLDHVVDGQTILPGAAYLELISRLTERKFNCFEHVFWLAPIQLQQSETSLTIHLESSQFNIKIGSTLHSQGTLNYHQGVDYQRKNIDLKAIYARCVQNIKKIELYERFQIYGLTYGSSLQVIKHFHFNQHEAIAELALSDTSLTLIDGAFQAVVGLTIQSLSHEVGQLVPYYAEKIEILADLTSVCFVHAMILKADINSHIYRFNITIYDEQGHPLIYIQQFAKKLLKKSMQAPIHYFQSVWKEQSIQQFALSPSSWLLLFEHKNKISNSIQKHYPKQFKVISVRVGKNFQVSSADEKRIIFKINPQSKDDFKALIDFLVNKNILLDGIIHGWNLEDEKLDTMLQQGIETLLYLTQTIIQEKKIRKIKLIHVFKYDHSRNHALAGLVAGFARTLNYENPHMIYHILGLDHKALKKIALLIIPELFNKDEIRFHEICYHDHIRRVKQIEPLIIEAAKNQELIKQKGVYVISGGAGGLGAIFANYLAGEYQATVIILGRRSTDEKIHSFITQLQKKSHAEYISTDVTNYSSLKKAIKLIKKKYKTIHGVIHAAGMIDDAFILQKKIHSFKNILDPKLHGVIYLDELTKNVHLDFFLLFSSVGAIIPNQGQCDYASANSFMDEFAAFRNGLVQQRKRYGKSLSINWPLWREGGMSVSVEEEKHLEQVFGMRALDKEAGIKIFQEALRQNYISSAHLIAIQGDEQKINQQFDIKNQHENHLKNKLISLLGQELNLPVDIFTQIQSFSDLNIDSAKAIQLISAINQNFFCEIKPTIFFQVKTIDELAEQLIAGKVDLKNSSLIDISKSNISLGQFYKEIDCHIFYMKDHVVNHQYNVPGACYVEMARQAFQLMNPQHKMFKLVNNYWVAQLSSSGEPIQVHMQVNQLAEKFHYEIFSLNHQQNKTIHAVGDLMPLAENATLHLDINKIKNRCEVSQKPAEIYSQILAEGLHVGPSFMPMQEIYLNKTETLAKLTLPEIIADSLDAYLLHPSLLTGVFQTALISNRFCFEHDQRHYIPVAIDELEIYQPFARDSYVYAQLLPTNHASHSLRKFNLIVCDEAGSILMRLNNFSIKGLKDANLQATSEKTLSLEGCEYYLKQLLGKEINLDPNEINSDTPFEAYGINSVLILQLNTCLEEKFGMLSKTLFFEYNNIKELAGYFFQHHQQALTRLLSISVTNNKQEENPIVAEEKIEPILDATHNSQDIAIIGLSGRYPMAHNIEAFWQILTTGKDCITEIPAERFTYHDYFDADKLQQKIYSKWGGFIADVDKFDPQFFNISPREAELMDPQERIFLQVVWEMLEDAGYTKESFIQHSQNIGVFVGALWQPYVNIGVEETLKGNPIGPSGLLYSIANRVSYFLGLHGPSLTIDTACSSSLTALHMACESIRHGESTAAIVGGVNLSLHSSKYLFLGQYQFLSTDGRCRSFGAEGDGYVPGEGIGAVLLKPLPQAVADNDLIYGVIKSSAINHGGKTNGYTVPNPNAQRDLIIKSLEKAQIDPRTISYVEAHGTGTLLGDPIEITGLTQAYARYTDDKQFCAIGSAKSNVGHLEAAAGICSLTKVLLQMKYKQLVPSIHATRLNPNIHFEQTPFYVQQTLTAWKASDQFPRRAAISSFGAGGSNAHVILEEAPITKPIDVADQRYYLITLSAHQEVTLQQRIYDLWQWFLRHVDEKIHVSAISYTLNACRSHFAWRCALIVKDVQTLIHKLEALYQKNISSDCYYGYAEKIITKVEQKDINSDLQVLGNLYVQGYEIDWRVLYPNTVCKLSLPTYPFLKDRYWIESSELKDQQSINKQVDPDFIYLTDHVIAGKKILPGVVSLEIARAVGESTQSDKQIIQMTGITWLQPITVDKIPITLTIQLQEESHKIRYEMVSKADNKIYNQGTLVLGRMNASSKCLNIQSMLESPKNSISKDKFYQKFVARGYQHGESLQSLCWIKKDEQRAIGYFELPQAQKNTEERTSYILHPSILDAGMQMIVSFTTEQAFPFTLSELHIYAPLTDKGYILVEASPTQGTAKSYNLSVTDLEGQVLVTIDGLNVRAHPHTNAELMCYLPNWRKSTSTTEGDSNIKSILVMGANEQQVSLLNSAISANLIFLPAINSETDYQTLVNSLPNTLNRILYLANNWNEHVDKDISGLFLLTQALNQKGFKQISLLYFSSSPYQWMEGFAKTIKQEHNGYHYCSIQTAASLNQENWLSIVLQELKSNLNDYQVIYDENNQRYHKSYEATQLISLDETKLPFKFQGVYLITGGLGNLGFIIAKYLAKNYRTQLIITGRSSLNQNLQHKLAELETLGAIVLYVQNDHADEVATNAMIQVAKSQFGSIQGIIHAAGINQDNRLVKKTLEEFKSVLASKVQGTLILDKCTQHEPLDFFVLFSSLSSVLGNVGQIDYASANSFLDSFAHWRNKQLEQNNRQGRTLSVNWPLWEEGGMQVDEESKRYLADSWGVESLPTEIGLTFFKWLMSEISMTQAIIAYGNKTKFKQAIAEKPQSILALTENNNLILQDKLELTLIDLVVQVLKFKSSSSIDKKKDLSFYGFDSITYTKLINELNQLFDFNLTPAIMFEYPTIAQLAEHLLKYYASQITSALKLEADLSVAAAEISSHVAKNAVSQTQDEIAIIGMQGIFPGCKNLAEFWRALVEENNLIQEVPIDRWDYHLYPEIPKWGGFISGIDKFDPEFFNISPKEAELMDPQQRLFLQVVWQAIEDAGYAVEELSKYKTGLFVGVATHDYAEILNQHQLHEAHVPTGVLHSVLANRVSYLLNLTGPSEAIDTACSSSLIAIHRAVRAIQTGDCDLAIAGGANAILTPSLTMSFMRAGMLSMDGRCKTFDASANGYVRGEGVGAILLKPLSRALEDRDVVYAVIKGSSVNHGGHVNTLTAPNPNAQAELIIDACKNVNSKQISYIEAHGTGTSLGDPIEMNGLKKAFKTLADATDSILVENSCAIGSVKSNIGHLEAAAGIAGLIKVLLMMQHKKLPGQLHFEKLNPYIELENSPFYIVSKTKTWESETPRCAGISAFGFGGSNAHIVIEEGPAYNLSKKQYKPYYLLAISAKHPQSLKQRIEDLYHYLQSHLDLPLEAIVYTLNVGRTHFNHRCALVVSSLEELQAKLEQIQNKEELSGYFKINAIKEFEDNVISQKILKITLEEIRGFDFKDTQTYKNNLEVLAHLYVKGYDLDWMLLHQGEAHQKMSLPTYPFLQEHYWVKKENDAELLVNDQLYPQHPKEPLVLATDNQWESAVEEKIFKIMRKILSLDEAKWDAQEGFRELGIDSIFGMEIVKQLNQEFSLNLKATILYEHPTPEKLVLYLIKTYSEHFKTLFAKEKTFLHQETSSNVQPQPRSELNSKIFPKEQTSKAQKDERVQGIAIVGMSGIFPGAKTLEELWQHLEKGDYLLRPVPEDHWDHKPY